MKRLNRIAAALILLALASTVASAKITSRTVTFGQDFYVGETAVKAGTYRLSFDDATNELSVIDRKTKAVVAKAAARMEKRGSALDVQMVPQGGSMALASFACLGKDQIIKIGNSTTASVK